MPGCLLLVFLSRTSTMQPEARQTKKSRGLEPDAYNDVIRNMRPLDVSVRALQFNVRTSGHGILKPSASLQSAVHCKDIAPIQADAAYITSIKQRAKFEFSDSVGVQVASGTCEFVVRLEFARKPPRAFWPIFLQRNTRLYTNPALRDLVSALAMRANFVSELLPSVAVMPGIRKATPATTTKSESKVLSPKE